MNRLLVLCLVVAISITEGYAASLRFKRQLVPREFQNINIENYLKNERAVRFQLKCIIDDGPCDRIGKYLKVTIPELLVNQCANCDQAQRERAGKLVSHIQQNFPTDWERAVKKFQGGLVKPEDAYKLETLLGVKLDPKLISEASTTTTAAPTTPEAKAAEVPSTSEVPVSTAAPASTSAPVSSTTVAASTTAAPASTAAPTSTAAPAPASSEAPSSTTAAAVVASSSEAPASSSEAPVTPVAAPAAPVAPAA